jgi:hypothetical protein
MHSVKTIDQLGKLIRLIFISDRPGEIANAIGAVRRLLASENLDAHWLAERLTTPIQIKPEPDVGQSTVWWCFHRRRLLSERDCDFIESIAKSGKSLSAKQQKWVADIVAKLEREGAA